MHGERTFHQRALLALAILAAVTVSVPAVDITLTWTAPVTNTDGSAIAGAVGYKLHYGHSPDIYTESIDVGDTNTATIVNADETNTYFFAVTCYDSREQESDYSTELVWISSPTADPDNDGMPDAWEIRHFKTTASSADDCDGDGTDDLSEYVAGTDPTDPDSQPTIGIVFDDVDVTIVFDTLEAAGPSYSNRIRYVTLEQCGDLSEGNWQPVTGRDSIRATNQSVTFADSANKRQRFFRFRINLE